MNDLLLNSEFYKSVRSANIEKINQLINAGFYIDEWDDYPLVEAVSMGAMELVATLIKAGFSPNHSCYFGGQFPLEVAIELENLEMINFLLLSGTDPNLGGASATPLICAVETGNIKIIKILLKAGACIHTSNEEGYTPLIAAVIIDNINLVRYLIKLGADPNKTTKDGETALVKAAELGNQKIFDYLLPLTSCSKQRKLAMRRWGSGVET